MDDKKWEAINEFITKQMQVNSDTAQLYVLYGAIALGLITFTLPHIFQDTEKLKSKWFKIRLIVGISCLSLGAVIFFWLSRTLTMQNSEYTKILMEFVVDQNLNITWLEEQIRITPPITEPLRTLSREHANCVAKIFRNLAKFVGAVGFASYVWALGSYFKSKL